MKKKEISQSARVNNIMSNYKIKKMNFIIKCREKNSIQLELTRLTLYPRYKIEIN
jgi:hypothetical protein